MKEKILELRKLGFSYKKIEKELGCSRSTISYHCNNNDLNIPIERIEKLSKEKINQILEDRKTLSINEVAKKHNVGVSTIKKYTKGLGPFYRLRKFNGRDKNRKSVCINCGNETSYGNRKKFCTVKCNAEYRHKQAYDDFLTNNNKYCNGNYTPKCFKDFFLEEQNNKCAICGIEPTWNGKSLIFVLDHIDGDASNNKRENLRLICPNCDSQTDTFKSKTKVSKRRNYLRTSIENRVKKEMLDNGGNLAG